MGQQVPQQWFDEFNQQCEVEEREWLRSLGVPIDKWIQELEDRTVILVKNQEKIQ